MANVFLHHHHPLLITGKHSFFLLHVLLLLLLLFCSGTAAQVRRTGGFRVRYLPGFQGPLPFHLETGYVGVGGENGDDEQLFYYFVKSERNPKEDPLVLWLTGGPRCSVFSAFAFELDDVYPTTMMKGKGRGINTELLETQIKYYVATSLIGPIYIRREEYNGSLPTLVLNPNSWTKVASIIFLDAPVWSGFSYSKDSSQHLVTTDTKSASHTYRFLIKWLIDHPEFLSNPLYVSGDSYSGKIIPVLVQELIDDIEAGKKTWLNFKGFSIGNPVTDYHLEKNTKIQCAHRMGLISDELYESLKQSCKGEYVNVDTNNERCSKDLDTFNECISDINESQILEPKCDYEAVDQEEIVKSRRSLAGPTEPFFSQLLPPTMCRTYGYLLSRYWANDASVQKALHIRKGTIKEWIRCNHDIPYQRDISNSIGYHRNLSTKGYRALIYSGDHDMNVSHVSTEAWIRLLNLNIVDDWHPWHVEGQVAGYTRIFSNGMTYATVKGGGHTAPEYRPKECFEMFKRWVSENPL